MEFHYFHNLDHTLNIGLYFVKGTLPDGHKAIFEFIRTQVVLRAIGGHQTSTSVRN
jgi:hypothetical protein